VEFTTKHSVKVGYDQNFATIFGTVMVQI